MYLFIFIFLKFFYTLRVPKFQCFLSNSGDLQIFTLTGFAPFGEEKRFCSPPFYSKIAGTLEHWNSTMLSACYYYVFAVPVPVPVNRKTWSELEQCRISCVRETLNSVFPILYQTQKRKARLARAQKNNWSQLCGRKKTPDLSVWGLVLLGSKPSLNASLG